MYATYKTIIQLYPKDFRKKYAQEMLDLYSKSNNKRPKLNVNILIDTFFGMLDMRQLPAKPTAILYGVSLLVISPFIDIILYIFIASLVGETGLENTNGVPTSLEVALQAGFFSVTLLLSAILIFIGILSTMRSSKLIQDQYEYHPSKKRIHYVFILGLISVGIGVYNLVDSYNQNPNDPNIGGGILVLFGLFALIASTIIITYRKLARRLSRS